MVLSILGNSSSCKLIIIYNTANSIIIWTRAKLPFSGPPVPQNTNLLISRRKLDRFASSKFLNSCLDRAVPIVTKTSKIGEELTPKQRKMSFFHVSLMYIFSCTQFWVCSTHKCLKTSRWDNYEFRACIWGVFWGVCAGLGHAWNAQIPPLSLSSPCSRKTYLREDSCIGIHSEYIWMCLSPS